MLVTFECKGLIRLNKFCFAAVASVSKKMNKKIKTGFILSNRKGFGFDFKIYFVGLCLNNSDEGLKKFAEEKRVFCQ